LYQASIRDEFLPLQLKSHQTTNGRKDSHFPQLSEVQKKAMSQQYREIQESTDYHQQMVIFLKEVSELYA